MIGCITVFDHADIYQHGKAEQAFGDGSGEREERVGRMQELGARVLERLA